MNDKKIYKWLQRQFAELNYKKIPKAGQRRDFEHFKAWMTTEKNAKGSRSFLMALHPEQLKADSLIQAAILQDMQLDLKLHQFEIEQAVQPLLRHYEQHQQEIGRHCDIRQQAAELMLSRIYALLQQRNCAMLLIDADQYYWIAVPEPAEKLNKFCKKFNRQFKELDIRIERFTVSDCLLTT